MATNNRSFYACNSVSLLRYAKGGDPTGNQIYAPRGLQSATVDTTYNLEEVFEIGQLDIYEQVESQPDISITLNKVLDGTMPLYFMSTDTTGDSTLSAMNAQSQCILWLNIYDETQSSASGTQLQSMMASGMYVQDITYTMPVDGNFTEEISYVGNDKYWYGKDVANGVDAKASGTYNFTIPAGDYDNTDVATTVGSGVQRRENLKTEACTFPTIIPGMTAVNAATDRTTAQAAFEEHVQSISVNTSLGREDIFQLGEKKAFYKYITYPIEVTCSFESISAEGDQISADSNYDNVGNETIKFITDSNLCFDLGTTNKLDSISLGGGDTGGGNVTVTYNFKNYNSLQIYPVTDQGVKQTVAAHGYNSIVENGSY